MTDTLYYVHDPMCSWCWGFAATLDSVLETLPDDISVVHLLGGLAPDSHEPMPESMQQGLQQTWKQIAEVIPGTEFNFAFWTDNAPRRSTWPSCRAVIAARHQSRDFERPMIRAIQRAYYLDAKNPSDSDTLRQCAKDIGCDGAVFSSAFESEDVNNEFLDELRQVQRFGVRGFPSLVLQKADGSAFSVPVEYQHANRILERIDHLRAT